MSNAFINTIILSFAALFMLIGLHQSMQHGLVNSYFLFMVSFGFLIWLQVRRRNGKTIDSQHVKDSKRPIEKSSSRKK